MSVTTLEKESCVISTTWLLNNLDLFKLKFFNLFWNYLVYIQYLLDAMFVKDEEFSVAKN